MQLRLSKHAPVTATVTNPAICGNGSIYHSRNHVPAMSWPPSMREAAIWSHLDAAFSACLRATAMIKALTGDRCPKLIKCREEAAGCRIAIHHMKIVCTTFIIHNTKYRFYYYMIHTHYKAVSIHQKTLKIFHNGISMCA